MRKIVVATTIEDYYSARLEFCNICCIDTNTFPKNNRLKDFEAVVRKYNAMLITAERHNAV
jgi:hypothetical protein